MEDRSIPRTSCNALAYVLALAACGVAMPVAAATADFDLDHGLRIRGDEWRLDVGARGHFDAADYDEDVTPLENDELIRRLRPTMALRYGDKLTVRADYDFGDYSDGWKNAWVGYRFSNRFDVRLGNQTVPFGLEESASSDDSMFMERPLATQLAPGLLTGLLARGHSGPVSYSLGVFANDLSSDDRRSIDGESVAGRLTYAPVRGRRQVLHMGVSAEYRNVSSGESIRYRARPESSATDVRFVDTGTLEGVDDVLTLGTELAWKIGPVLLQSEYLTADLSGSDGTDATLDGWYVGGSLVIAGRQRSYSRHSGSFGGVRPRSRWGAVELVARYGSLDLADGLLDGGEQRNASVGVNWNWNENCRLMLDYIDVDADPNADGIEESPSILQARLQLGF